MAVTGTYSPNPFLQWFDGSGAPLTGGHLLTYAAGGYAPTPVYSDVTLTTPHPNPIILDAAGRPAQGPIFLTPGASYHFVLEDQFGTVIKDADNIMAVPSSLKNAQFGIAVGGDFSTSSTQWIDFVGFFGTMLTRGGAVLAEATFPGVVTAGGAYFQWNLDGADLGVVGGVCQSTTVTQVTLQWTFGGLSIGTHQITLRVKVQGGGTFTSPMGSQAAGSLSLLEVNV